MRDASIVRSCGSCVQAYSSMLCCTGTAAIEFYCSVCVAWLCRSGSLARRFGWHASPPAYVLAAQLQALGSMHRSVSTESIGQRIAVAIPDIYKSLTEQSVPVRQEACLTLQTQPCVFVGAGFVPPDHVAFR